MNRFSRLKITLYLAAIFLAGSVTGALALMTVGKYVMMTSARPEKMAARWCNELQTGLNLTPEQLQKIRPIVDDCLNDVRACLTQQLSTTISNSNSRIAAELTPEQQVKFQQMIKEREDMLRRKLGEKTGDAPKTH